MHVTSVQATSVQATSVQATSVQATSVQATTASLFEDAPEVSQPIATKAAPSARVSPPRPLPAVALTLPADSGLELVETRFNAAPPRDETPEPPRPKRVRPPRVEIASEPLEIIETTKGSQPPLS